MVIEAEKRVKEMLAPCKGRSDVQVHQLGPDVAPVHDRQVCVLEPEDWAAWLFGSKP